MCQSFVRPFAAASREIKDGGGKVDKPAESMEMSTCGLRKRYHWKMKRMTLRESRLGAKGTVPLKKEGTRQKGWVKVALERK